MKIIPKYDQGSILKVSYLPTQNTFVAPFQEGTTNDSEEVSAKQKNASKSSKSSKDDKKSIIDSGVMKMIAEKGLRSDVSEFVQRVRKLLPDTTQQQFNAEFGLATSKPNYDYIRLQVAELLNDVFSEKELFLKGVDAINSAEAQNEVAISKDGTSAFMLDENRHIVSVNPLAALKSGVRLLTNAEIMYYRQGVTNGMYTDTANAFNSDAISAMYSATSMKKIRDVIDDCMKQVSTEKTSFNTFEDTSKYDSILKEWAEKNNISIGTLQRLETTDQLLKVTKTTESNKKALSKVLLLVESSLTPAMKTLLNMRATQLGISNRGLLIEEYINKSLKNERSITLDIETLSDPNKSSSTKKSGSGNSSGSSEDAYDKENLTPASLFQNNLGSSVPVEINNGGRMSILTQGNVGPYDPDTFTLAQMRQGSFRGILDFDHVYMGNQKLKRSALDRVALLDSKIAQAYLPVAEGSTSMDKKVDLESLEKLNDAMKELRRRGIKVEDAVKNVEKQRLINETLVKHGLKIMFANGRLLSTNYDRFGVITARASEQAIADKDGADKAVHKGTLLKVTDSDERDAYRNQINYTLDKEHKLKFSDGLFGIGADDIYEGTVFIPIYGNNNSAAAGDSSWGRKSSGSIAAAEREATIGNVMERASSLNINNLRNRF